MRKFAPLDLSFIANAGSPERESIRNVASMINASAGWGQASQSFLNEYAAAKKAAEKDNRHKSTFIGGLFDLLQAPLYGVANAMDEALAGHQSDNNDSVLEDIGKTIGGVFTGLPKGVGAGLRGATQMLDTLPGVDISDEWQTDPTDKTHMSDVAIRKETGMSSADARKPENWDKAKEKLSKAQDKSVWDKTLFQLLIPDNLEGEDSQAEFLRKFQMAGIPVDIAGDPLNLLGAGLLNTGRKAASGITEGVKEASKLGELTKPILTGSKVAPEISKASKFGEAPIKGTPVPEMTATANDLTSVGSVVKPEFSFKTAESVGKRESVPVSGLEIPERAQTKMVKDITALAARGEKGWVYKAADILRASGKVDFARTLNFLERADQMVKSRGIKHNPAGLSGALKAHIAEDVQAARKVVPSERLLNTARPEEILAAGTPAAKVKLRPQQAQIANEVIAKFAPQILGKAKAPGTGEALQVAIRAGANARWSGPQQVRMWNQLTSKFSHLPAKVRYDVSAKVLQHIEDYFLSKGVVPYSAAKISESVEGLRLSQVAMAVGPKTLADNPKLVTRILKGDEEALKSLTPEQLQKIENLKAAESVASAPAVQEGISAAKNIAQNIIKQPLSAARKAEMLTEAAKTGAKVSAASGAGPVASNVTKEYLAKLFSDPTGIDGVFKSARLDTEVFLARSGKMDGKFNPVDKKFTESVTRAISKAASLPPPKTLGSIAGPAARVKDWLGGRFNAAYGVTDMRPIFLRNQASALSTSARRGVLLNNLAKRFPPTDKDLWHEAFRASQMDSMASGRVGELQSEISKVMEDLFGGTGLKAGAMADSTVASRSHLYMHELNAQLRRFGLADYQFKAGKKIKDASGNVHDFSKGADWLKSWEIWNVKSPYDFLHRVQNAVEHTVREKNMFDEIASRFASLSKAGNVKYGVNHPRLKGYYFTEEGARQGEQFVKILKEVNTPSPKSLQHLDHVISKLKASLTIYIPSHHWTNIIGDVMFNWFAGVNDVRRYKQAVNVMSSQKGRYGDIAEFKNLAGPDAFKQALARGMIGTETLSAAGLKTSAAGNAIVATSRSGHKFTADMIYTAAMREGILPNARVLEEITSDTSSMLDKFRPLGGRGQAAAHKISEVRDHIPRLAQFIDGISKSKGSISEAIESSAASVRKWHPDGLDLTRFERGVMKRVFPFYSWTRKAIPLAIESALVNGNKVMAYPRLMEEIALANGIDAPPGEQFPTDQLFPDWMRERGIGPIAGGPGSYLMANPSTPALDIFTMMGHPGQTSLDMLNPLARVPLELAQGSTLGKGVPIENEASYLAMQVPGLSQAGRVTGAYGVSDSVANSSQQQLLNLLNLLTGAKATQSGIYQKSAEFDLRDYIRQQREKG